MIDNLQLFSFRLPLSLCTTYSTHAFSLSRVPSPAKLMPCVYSKGRAESFISAVRFIFLKCKKYIYGCFLIELFFFKKKKKQALKHKLKLIITLRNSITSTLINIQREDPYKYPPPLLINYMCVIHARQMWEGTHTCCGQKIKLGPLYIIRCFNGRLKWEICSICLVSLKDQEETTMSALACCMNQKKKKKKLGQRQWGGHMEA